MARKKGKQFTNSNQRKLVTYLEPKSPISEQFRTLRTNIQYSSVDEDMQTNMKNVFACGDIISKRFKQVITACADGAIAGNSGIGGK